MDIINIITTEHNRVNDIESFAVVCPEEQGIVAIDAEDCFMNKVKELAKPKIIDDFSIEDYKEDGYYEKDGIAISIVWSNSVNE